MFVYNTVILYHRTINNDYMYVATWYVRMMTITIEFDVDIGTEEAGWASAL